MATYISGQWKWGGVHNQSLGNSGSFTTLWSVPAGQMWFLTYYTSEAVDNGDGTASIGVYGAGNYRYAWTKHREDTGSLATVQYTGGSTSLSLTSTNFKRSSAYNSGYTSAGISVNPPDLVGRDEVDAGSIWLPGEDMRHRRTSGGTTYNTWSYWYMEI